MGIGLRGEPSDRANGESDDLFAAACRLLGEGQPQKAATLLEHLISLEPGHAEAHSKLGVACIMQGRRPDAIRMFQRAIKLDPSFVAPYHNLAIALGDESDWKMAAQYAEEGHRIDPGYLPLYSSLARALKYLDRPDEAIAYLRQALCLKEDDVQLLSNLAGFLLESGQADEAREMYRRVIAIDPAHATAHRTLAFATRYQKGDPHLKQMEQLLKKGAFSPMDAHQIHFALGKAYEELGEFKTSFRHYELANDAVRSSLPYDPDEEEGFFAQIKEAFTAEFIAAHTLGPSAKTPVFVLGMPRSGTTLVEQILASHPDVYAAGELSQLGWLQFTHRGIKRHDYRRAIGALSREDRAEMADSYLGHVESKLQGRSYFTDKMPLNFRYIGLIRCLFPNAKIIHCVRDPRDVGLSIYKTLFVGPMGFAYNLSEIGRFSCLYSDLMRHWHTVVPGFVFDLDYETLVSEPRKTVENLLEFCGLPWSERCLSFYETPRAVTTASTLQVRQPIYRDAIGYWKNYEPYLGDLLRELRQCGLA